MGDISICLPHFTFPRPTYLAPFQHNLTCLQVSPISVLTFKTTLLKSIVYILFFISSPFVCSSTHSILASNLTKTTLAKIINYLHLHCSEQIYTADYFFLPLLLLFHLFTSLATPFLAQFQTSLHLSTFKCWIFSSLSHGSPSSSNPVPVSAHSDASEAR